MSTSSFSDQCDHFFYHAGSIRGVYPCGQKMGHVGPHLHADEDPEGTFTKMTGNARFFSERSEWMTEAVFGKLPAVIERRTGIKRMREFWERTGVMPRGYTEADFKEAEEFLKGKR